MTHRFLRRLWLAYLGRGYCAMVIADKEALAAAWRDIARLAWNGYREFGDPRFLELIHDYNDTARRLRAEAARYRA